MSTVTPYGTLVDPDIYRHFLGIMGFTPELEPIDVTATLSLDLCSDRQSTRYESPGRIGFALGCGAGHLRKTATKVSSFFGRREVKTAALTAHWAVWSVFVAVALMMSTSFFQVLFVIAVYLYLTNILFEAMILI